MAKTRKNKITHKQRNRSNKTKKTTKTTKTTKTKKTHQKFIEFRNLYTPKTSTIRLSSNDRKELNKHPLTKKLMTAVKKDLEKVGVLLHVSPVHITNGFYIQDHAWTGLDIMTKQPTLIPILRMNEENRLYIPPEGFSIQHYNVSNHKEMKKVVMDILKRHFKNKKVEWNGSESKAIMIV